jgi:hypothetical protein
MVPHPKATVFATTPEVAAQGALSVVADGRNAANISAIRAESVAALQHAVLGQEYEPDGGDLSILKGHELVYQYTTSHGGWLFRFPAEMVQLLAAVPDGRLGDIARRWSLIFENDGPPVPEEGEVEGMLRQVITIAQAVVARQLSMYWLQEGC